MGATWWPATTVGRAPDRLPPPPCFIRRTAQEAVSMKDYIEQLQAIGGIEDIFAFVEKNNPPAPIAMDVFNYVLRAAAWPIFHERFGGDSNECVIPISSRLKAFKAQVDSIVNKTQKSVAANPTQNSRKPSEKVLRTQLEECGSYRAVASRYYPERQNSTVHNWFVSYGIVNNEAKQARLDRISPKRKPK